MITLQQVRTSTMVVAATVALASALAIGGLAGYTVRGLEQPRAAARSSAPAQVGGLTGAPSAIGDNLVAPARLGLTGDKWITSDAQSGVAGPGGSDTGATSSPASERAPAGEYCGVGGTACLKP